MELLDELNCSYLHNTTNVSLQMGLISKYKYAQHKSFKSTFIEYLTFNFLEMDVV